ncbi:MAG: rod shape-determining protein MreD [Deltaproteobacteria bacterium]|nr:rod shape-determining protein MreD [Deltaproteobacteria bacterium]
MLHLVLLTLSALTLILGQMSLPLLPVSPNPTLIIVTYVGQFYSPITGLVISFILGYFLDVTTGALLGLNSFSMVSLCYLSFVLGKRIVMQSGLAQTLTVFIFSIIYSGIVYSLFSFFSINISIYPFVRTAVGNGIVTALFSPILITAIKRMELTLRFKNERDEGSKDIKV